MEVEHVPTGIKRHHPPPLNGAQVQKQARERFLREIEAELIKKGLTQYIDDDRKATKGAFRTGSYDPSLSHH